ncbi:MAG: tRNA (adenosine(37)-N6)-dimethylallyltransferase MiaA [Arenicellales bacterium]|jgi:tRNA dimethylallyltransferase
MSEIPPVVFLMGPTATGKTDLAASLSEVFPLELISVDAAQVYKGMDIGTAKPVPSFLKRYPHHLIDVRNPDQTYSAADFVSDASILIDDIRTRGRVPVLVGGTMFYFRALETGLSKLPSANLEIRQEISRELSLVGIAALYGQLQQIDPNLAGRINPNDSQRVQRAIEIHRASGKVPSELMMRREGLGRKPLKLLLFSADRILLHNRIAHRFHTMLEQGLIDEISQLMLGLNNPRDLPSMRTVGYRQVLEYLDQEVSYKQMVENSIAATRQLAKRQLTWLRQQSGAVWFEAGNHPPTDIVIRYMQQQTLGSAL